MFSGSIDATGWMHGTWTNTRWGDEGTFEGVRTSRPVPEIAVEQPSYTPLASGDSRNFGTVATRKKSTLTFTIRNVGSADLTGMAITVTGPAAFDFKVTGTLAAPLKPGKSKTFKVQFAPTTAGAKSAQLRIASNDADENPYVIDLTGTAMVP